MPIWLLGLSALLICALRGIYAWHLWRQVWAREAARTQAQLAQKERLAEDLRVLASTLLDGQLPLIEGAIRIKVLLDNFDSALSLDPSYQVFHQLYEATADVPTHNAWKALSKEHKRDFQARFDELEAAYSETAQAAARHLLSTALSAH